MSDDLSQWEVMGGIPGTDAWMLYPLENFSEIEAAFQRYLADPGNSDTATHLLQGASYAARPKYRLDFRSFTQQNIETKFVRAIRRLPFYPMSTTINLYAIDRGSSQDHIGPENSLLLDTAPPSLPVWLNFPPFHIDCGRFVADLASMTVTDTFSKQTFTLTVTGQDTLQRLRVMAVPDSTPASSSATAKPSAATATASKTTPPTNPQHTTTKVSSQPQSVSQPKPQPKPVPAVKVPFEIRPLPLHGHTGKLDLTQPAKQIMQELGIRALDIASSKDNCAVCMGRLVKRGSDDDDDDDDDEDDDDEDDGEPVQLPCKHEFHDQCIVMCIKGRSFKCPVCPTFYGEPMMGNMPE